MSDPIRFWISCFGPLSFFFPKLLNYLVFKYFGFERTWRKLFWAYLTKVILSVPDEGYSERTWWRLFQKHVVCTTFYIYVFILRTSLNNFDMLSQHCEIPSGIVEIFRWFFFQSCDVLSVPNEVYSRNASWELILISTFLFQCKIYNNKSRI